MNLSSRYFLNNLKVLNEKSLVLRNYCDNKKYNVLFFGSDGIALTSLRKINDYRLKEKRINRLDLVTANNLKNKSLVEKFAVSQKIKTIQWPLAHVNAGEYDIGLIVAFGHLIKDDVLNKFPLGMLNVHPSLLPRWRGAAPIIHTLLHGDEETGVSLMKIKPNIFDVGEIISQQRLPVPKNIKLPELTDQLSEIGAQMLVQCLRDLPKSLEKAQPQSNVGVTYAKKINKDISEVRWTEMTAIQVYNLHRAIFGIYSLTTKFRDKPVKLFDAFLHNTDQVEHRNMPVGSLEYCEKTNALRILCKDRKYVYFRSLRIVGKKEIKAIDFYNGYIKNMPLEKRNYVVC